MKRIAGRAAVAMSTAVALLAAGCARAGEDEPGQGNGDSGEVENAADVEPAQNVDGAGATFPAPLYNEMFQSLAEESGIQVNYQSVGSGAGIEQYTENTVDFGATDGPMTDEEIAEVTDAGRNVMHVATVGGPVVPTYNLPGVDELNLTGQVLADIYLGNITAWDDQAIAELNPDQDLPSTDIQVVHRSDGSGTTFIFVDYLAGASDEWANQVGSAKDVNWPTGSGGDGNDGVAAQVQQTENSIGYTELSYAEENDLAHARIGDTPDGPFVEGTLESAQAAISGVEVPDDLRVSVSGENVVEADDGTPAYPITGLTWLLVDREFDDLATCKAVAEAAWYAIHDGQEFAPPHYVPIAGDVVEQGEEMIQSMEASGEPCYES